MNLDCKSIYLRQTYDKINILYLNTSLQTRFGNLEIVFWNVNNNKRAIDIIADSRFSNSRQLFAFAEYWDISDHISTKFTGRTFWIHDVMKRTGFIYSELDLKQIKAERYYTHISFDYNDLEVHVWIVHLKSKLNSEQASESRNRETIKEIVSDVNSNNYKYSMIVGDFNIAHFDNTMLDVFHLNSTHYFGSNEPEEKIFDEQRRVKFYNPIASLSGDLSKGPPGTYYYNLPNQSQAWHTFDMALVSYGLSKYLNKEECEIITELNGISLTKENGRPDDKISDHFPIRIKFR